MARTWPATPTATYTKLAPRTHASGRRHPLHPPPTTAAPRGPPRLTVRSCRSHPIPQPGARRRGGGGAAFWGRGTRGVTHLAETPRGRRQRRGWPFTPGPAAARQVARGAAHRPDVAHVKHLVRAVVVVRRAAGAGVPVVLTCTTTARYAPRTRFRDAGLHRCLTGSAWQAVPTAATALGGAVGSRPDHRAAARAAHLARGVDVLRALTISIGRASSRAPAGGRHRSGELRDREGPRPVPIALGTVLFVGRLTEEKGAPPLLRGLAPCRPAGGWSCCGGDGPQRAASPATPPAWPAGSSADRVRAPLERPRALMLPLALVRGPAPDHLDSSPRASRVATDTAAKRGGRPSDAVAVTDGPGQALPALPRRLARRREPQVRRRYQESYTPEVALAALERVYASVTAPARA